MKAFLFIVLLACGYSNSIGQTLSKREFKRDWFIPLAKENFDNEKVPYFFSTEDTVRGKGKYLHLRHVKGNCFQPVVVTPNGGTVNKFDTLGAFETRLYKIWGTPYLDIKTPQHKYQYIIRSIYKANGFIRLIMTRTN